MSTARVDTPDRASSPESQHQTSKDASPTTSEAPKEVGEEGEEESQASAYNEETGEINWDCPCLGGMAHGPCGEEFKQAFSCFVTSESEPKGMDCVEFFQTMQECFKKHPEEYANELDDDDDEEEERGKGKDAVEGSKV